MSAREPIAGSVVDVEIGYARLTLLDPVGPTADEHISRCRTLGIAVQLALGRPEPSDDFVTFGGVCSWSDCVEEVSVGADYLSLGRRSRIRPPSAEGWSASLFRRQCPRRLFGPCALAMRCLGCRCCASGPTPAMNSQASTRLAEPIVRLLMIRDRVDESALRRLAAHIAKGIAGRREA